MSKALYSLIYSYTSVALYTLSLIYYTSPHILHHSYILLYPLLYTLLYTLLLFSNNITNLAPPFYTYSLLYTILLYTYPPHFSPLSCILSTAPHLIYCYTYSLIWKGYNYAAADFYTFYIAILIYIIILIFTAALISTVVLLHHF